MPSMYLVSVRWAQPNVDVEMMDRALDRSGEWFRYSSNTWLVWTDSLASDIRTVAAGALSPKDGLLVIRVDPSDLDGFAPEQLWQWLGPKTAPHNALAGAMRRG